MAPNPIIISQKNIHELIPQKFPFVMIGNLLSSDEKKTVTNFTIDKNNIFCSEGLFREPGLVENIAQTAAARVGYECLKANIPVPIGFIGAIKNLKIHFLPEENATLQTEIRIDYEILDFTLITGEVYLNERLAATCEMKIFLKKN